MKEKDLTPRALALAGEHDPIAQATIQKTQALNAYLARKAREMAPEAFRLAERAEGKAAIVAEVSKLRQERRAALAQALEDRREGWQRDFYRDLPRHDFDLRAYQLRLNAMSQSDFEHEAEAFANGQDFDDPNMVYALGAKANELGLPVHRELIKQRATARRAYEPWTQGSGAAEYDELKRLEKASPSEVYVNLLRPDKKLQAEAFSLDTFIDEIDGGVA